MGPFGPADQFVACRIVVRITTELEEPGMRLAPTNPAPSGTTRLTVSVPAEVGRLQALAVLGRSRRHAWVGEVVEDGAAGKGWERHLVDLELQFSEQVPRISFRKAAYVDLGPISARPGEPIRIPISWRAAGLAPLFPVFSGTLSWSRRDLILDGYYAPPGGGIGIVADRLLLNMAARATPRLLLQRIATAMRDEET